MKVQFILINFFIVKVFTNTINNFIIDYFVYKKVSTVVGFTCNNNEDDFLLTRYFNKEQIKVAFIKLKDVSKIHRLIHTDYYKTGVVMDIRCYDSQRIALAFSEATNNKVFDDLHCWLIIMAYHHNVTNLINDEAFDLSTDFVIARLISNHDFTLYDIFNPSKAHGGKLNVTFFGTWNKTNGLYVALIQNKYDRRSNLHGFVWRVAYLASKYKPPNVSLENHLQDYQKTGTKDGMPKFGFNLVKHLSEMYNATILLRQYGRWKKGDRSGPLTRALVNNEIDMTGYFISVIPEKLSMIKFVYPAWPFRTCFIFRSPQPKNIKIDEILWPFDAGIWYMCIAMIILFIFGLAMTFNAEGFDRGLMRYSNSALMTIGSICQQSTCLKLNYISTRMMYMNIMLFSLIMYNYYSALVVSARLNEPIVKLEDSLTRLAKTDMKVASEPMIYFEFLMKDNGNDAEYFNRYKWQKVDESERFILPEKGMHLVQKGGFAYHTHPDVAYPYINRLYDNREICELTEVHLGRLSYRSIAIAYNSSFTEISKRGFARISEVGIRHRQFNKWTSRKPLCRRDILSASSITIYEFAPQLIISLFGLILAITICGVEVLIENYQKNMYKYLNK